MQQAAYTSMDIEIESGLRREPAKLDSTLLAQLKGVATLSPLSKEELSALEGAEYVDAAEGSVLFSPGEEPHSYWAVLSGEIAVSKTDGKYQHESAQQPGHVFGEVPLLLGWNPISSTAVATKASRLLRVPFAAFWKMMAASPSVRECVLVDFSRKFETHQAMTLHREKLISLGTLAAGLMHELNNPGAAARRAASQLRENMTRLQAISLRMTRSPFTPCAAGVPGALAGACLLVEPASYPGLA